MSFLLMWYTFLSRALYIFGLHCLTPVSLCDRDGNIPVSFIQKYLMRKLDLKSETEVSNLLCAVAILPFLACIHFVLR